MKFTIEVDLLEDDIKGKVAIKAFDDKVQVISFGLLPTLSIALIAIQSAIEKNKSKEDWTIAETAKKISMTVKKIPEEIACNSCSYYASCMASNRCLHGYKSGFSKLK